MLEARKPQQSPARGGEQGRKDLYGLAAAIAERRRNLSVRGKTFYQTLEVQPYVCRLQMIYEYVRSPWSCTYTWVAPMTTHGPGPAVRRPLQVSGGRQRTRHPVNHDTEWQRLLSLSPTSSSPPSSHSCIQILIIATVIELLCETTTSSCVRYQGDP